MTQPTMKAFTESNPEVDQFFHALELDVETFIDTRKELIVPNEKDRIADKEVVRASIISVLQKLKEIFLEDGVEMEGKSYNDLHVMISGLIKDNVRIDLDGYQEPKMVQHILTLVLADITDAKRAVDNDYPHVPGGRSWN